MSVWSGCSSVIRILHISDLHFGPPYVPRVGEEVLRLAPTVDADAIVISGDFTQRAKEEQFIAARDFVERLPDLPRLVVPGNHDVPLYRIRERLFEPHDLYRRYISPELNSVLRIDGATLVGLDSTAPLRAITNGRIDSEDLAFCLRALQEAPSGDARIVVAHHHFAPAPDYEGDRAMPKAKRAIELFTRLEVDLILGGHLHRAYVGNSLDVYPGIDRSHGITIVQSGTTTSRRGRAREHEKNSFNVIEITPRMMHIFHHMYFDDIETFAPIARYSFPRVKERFLRRDALRDERPSLPVAEVSG